MNNLPDSILDNDIVEPLNDPITSKEKLDEYLSRLHMKVYPFALYFAFLEGLATIVLIIVRFIEYGFNDPLQIEDTGKGQTSVLLGYLAITQCFVFWAGIKAKFANSYEEQNRFQIFLRVFLYLLFIIWLFLLLAFWAIQDATSGTLIFFTVQAFVNLVIFALIYLGGYRFNAFLRKIDGNFD